ncbi:Putative SOS response-associated peptidase YedK [Ferrithrix thermotolerans DSM 19514]|uniref:Abasic site processing protein n=1 Tax=Ferrithrix thermotolerans DSM 19514 TaxID=1121881 RepID=A0A1M4UKI8_9ACTN|nr:SOS response-associated peptidase family protein [Ferrithrix thermotolerans]SHE57246.1 Putative SOS response-associated peptidase YedK [Ferrithrix thermotolerans DSM 19514]
MCGRFAQLIELEELVDSGLISDLSLTNINEVNKYLSEKQIRPTQPCVVFTTESSSKEASASIARFGAKVKLGGNSSPKLLINARAETALDKPLFHKSLMTRRCIVPVSGYYEWSELHGGKRVPYLIHPQGNQIAKLAGILLRDAVSGGEGVLVITTDASQSVSHIHHRQPLHLSQQETRMWLSRETSTKDISNMLIRSDQVKLHPTQIASSYLGDREVSLAEASTSEYTEQLRLF